MFKCPICNQQLEDKIVPIHTLTINSNIHIVKDLSDKVQVLVYDYDRTHNRIHKTLMNSTPRQKEFFSKVMEKLRTNIMKQFLKDQKK